MTRRPTDGRRAKGVATREAILAATRKVLTSGNFRPDAKAIVRADGFAPRSINQHFPSLESLYLAAIDADTAHDIAGLILALPDEISIAHAVVLGRLPNARGAA